MTSALQRRKLSRAFELLDVDGDGALTVTELVHAASELYVGNDPAAGNSFFGPSN